MRKRYQLGNRDDLLVCQTAGIVLDAFWAFATLFVLLQYWLADEGGGFIYQTIFQSQRHAVLVRNADVDGK
jgi:hypothetical protein